MDEVGNAIPRWLRTGAIGWIGAVSTTTVVRVLRLLPPAYLST